MFLGAWEILELVFPAYAGVILNNDDKETYKRVFPAYAGVILAFF